MPPPLILTARFAAADQARFDALRRRHFPPQLNHIGAHLTMFHHLPGEDEAEVDAALRRLAATQPPCIAAVTGLRSLGRGVAFHLDCPPLARLRGAVARTFHDRLTAQDRQGWRPHGTIQNKVAPAEAAALLAAMQAVFSPFDVAVTGLCLWHYRGGPWTPAGEYPFDGAEPAPAACQ